MGRFLPLILVLSALVSIAVYSTQLHLPSSSKAVVYHHASAAKESWTGRVQVRAVVAVEPLSRKGGALNASTTHAGLQPTPHKDADNVIESIPDLHTSAVASTAISNHNGSSNNSSNSIIAGESSDSNLSNSSVGSVTLGASGAGYGANASSNISSGSTNSSSSSSNSNSDAAGESSLSNRSAGSVTPGAFGARPSSNISSTNSSSSNNNSITPGESSGSNMSSNSAGSATPGAGDVASPSRDSSSNGSSSSDVIAYYRESVLPAFTAANRAGSDSAYLQKLQNAATQSINIAVMTSLWWDLPANLTSGCHVDGVPLNCHIQLGGSEGFVNKADALFYHVPTFAGQPRAKAFSTQLRLAMSLESSAQSPDLDRPEYMCHFDAEMTYRSCGQVKSWYSLELFDKMFQTKPVPFEEKLHAIVYINTNCAARSGRSDIMRALLNLGDNLKVPVHSLGRCDNNMPWPTGTPDKVDVMTRYKFCVAMENSIRQDYISEKLWDALVAGCIPIYLGSSNARYTVPDPDSFILYDASGKTGHASTPEQLAAVVNDIGSDKAKYEAMLAWKHRKPEEQPNDVFRYLWSVRHTTRECFLCQFLARHRAEPQEEYTTCLFNKDWMEKVGQPYIAKEQACPTGQT